MELEDFITLATPEGIELELVLAGLGSRLIARSIDLAIRLALILVLALALAAAGDLGLAVLSIAAFLVLFAYDVVFEVLGSGQTPGKRWTGLRVVRSGGAPVDLPSSAVRNIARLVDGLTFAYLPTVLAILATAKNQRPGDLAADTVVIRAPRTARRQRAVPPPATPALDWDVSAITAEELAVVRRFLDRRGTLESEPRETLARRLADRLRPRVAGAGHDLAAERFLETLLATKAARSGRVAAAGPPESGTRGD